MVADEKDSLKKLVAHLEKCKKRVEKWPKWKREQLERILKNGET